MKQDTTQNDSVVGSDAGQRMGSFAEAAGKILAISYPVLAISTGARAVYQLFLKEGVTDRLPPALTAVAALLYLVATGEKRLSLRRVIAAQPPAVTPPYPAASAPPAGAGAAGRAAGQAHRGHHPAQRAPFLAAAAGLCRRLRGQRGALFHPRAGVVAAGDHALAGALRRRGEHPPPLRAGPPPLRPLPGHQARPARPHGAGLGGDQRRRPTPAMGRSTHSPRPGFAGRALAAACSASPAGGNRLASAAGPGRTARASRQRQARWELAPGLFRDRLRLHAQMARPREGSAGPAAHCSAGWRRGKVRRACAAAAGAGPAGAGERRALCRRAVGRLGPWWRATFAVYALLYLTLGRAASDLFLRRWPCRTRGRPARSSTTGAGAAAGGQQAGRSSRRSASRRAPRRYDGSTALSTRRAGGGPCAGADSQRRRALEPLPGGPAGGGAEELAARLPGWLAVWYRLEALNNLANLAYLNPHYSFATLGDTGALPRRAARPSPAAGRREGAQRLPSRRWARWTSSPARTWPAKLLLHAGRQPGAGLRGRAV